MKKASRQTISRLRRSVERSRRGGKGHRVSGDTAESWFQNRRFRSRKVGGGYRRTTPITIYQARRKILGAVCEYGHASRLCLAASCVAVRTHVSSPT